MMEAGCSYDIITQFFFSPKREHEKVASLLQRQQLLLLTHVLYVGACFAEFLPFVHPIRRMLLEDPDLVEELPLNLLRLTDLCPHLCLQLVVGVQHKIQIVVRVVVTKQLVPLECVDARKVLMRLFVILRRVGRKEDVQLAGERIILLLLQMRSNERRSLRFFHV